MTLSPRWSEAEGRLAVPVLDKGQARHRRRARAPRIRRATMATLRLAVYQVQGLRWCIVPTEKNKR